MRTALLVAIFILSSVSGASLLDDARSFVSGIFSEPTAYATFDAGTLPASGEMFNLKAGDVATFIVGAHTYQIKANTIQSSPDSVSLLLSSHSTKDDWTLVMNLPAKSSQLTYKNTDNIMIIFSHVSLSSNDLIATITVRPFVRVQVGLNSQTSFSIDGNDYEIRASIGNFGSGTANYVSPDLDRMKNGATDESASKIGLKVGEKAELLGVTLYTESVSLSPVYAIVDAYIDSPAATTTTTTVSTTTTTIPVTAVTSSTTTTATQATTTTTAPVTTTTTPVTITSSTTTTTPATTTQPTTQLSLWSGYKLVSFDASAPQIADIVKKCGNSNVNIKNYDTANYVYSNNAATSEDMKFGTLYMMNSQDCNVDVPVTASDSFTLIEKRNHVAAPFAITQAQITSICNGKGAVQGAVLDNSGKSISTERSSASSSILAPRQPSKPVETGAPQWQYTDKMAPYMGYYIQYKGSPCTITSADVQKLATTTTTVPSSPAGLPLPTIPVMSSDIPTTSTGNAIAVQAGINAIGIIDNSASTQVNKLFSSSCYLGTFKGGTLKTVLATGDKVWSEWPESTAGRDRATPIAQAGVTLASVTSVAELEKLPNVIGNVIPVIFPATATCSLELTSVPIEHAFLRRGTNLFTTTVSLTKDDVTNLLTSCISGTTKIMSVQGGYDSSPFVTLDLKGNTVATDTILPYHAYFVGLETDSSTVVPTGTTNDGTKDRYFDSSDGTQIRKAAQCEFYIVPSGSPVTYKFCNSIGCDDKVYMTKKPNGQTTYYVNGAAYTTTSSTQTQSIGGDVGTASVMLKANVAIADAATTPSIGINIQNSVSDSDKNAIVSALASSKLGAVAYSAAINVANIKGTDNNGYTIEMKVGKSFPDKYGLSNIKIMGKSSGGPLTVPTTFAMLTTTVIGSDVNGAVTFRGTSQNAFTEAVLIATA